MTWISGSTQKIAGHWRSSIYPGRGIKVWEIPSQGTDGPAFLFPDIALIGAQPNDEMRARMISIPSAGIFTLNENSTFSFTNAPDGVYRALYEGLLNGVPYGVFTLTFSIGDNPKAVTFQAGSLTQISDADVGDGQKPVVLHNGEVKVQSASEGTPIIYDPVLASLRTIAGSEHLLI